MRNATLALGVLPGFFLLLGSLPAQGGQAPATTNAGPAQIHPARAPDTRPPVVQPRPVPPPGPSLPVPVGQGSLQQPKSPPVSEIGPLGPGTMRFWKNVAVRPASTSSCCPEPSASIARDTGFMTANTWAGISKDSGHTWSYVNPATRFPSVDGGFCCDQRSLYVESHDITIWFLQYRRSTTTRRGSVRIAVANGRDGLRSNAWHSWVWSPQHFNQPLGRWFDFPDIAVTSKYLYATCNVFDFSTPKVKNMNSVLWRMPLSQLKATGNLSAGYYTRTSPGSPGKLGATGSYRFAQGFGSTMYWGSQFNTSTLRIYAWADTSAAAVIHDRAVPTWSNATRVAKAPNGVNWLAFQDSRVQSGYRVTGEFGFMWSAAQQTGRPYPFIRVARFRTSNMTLINAQDTWATSFGFGYPAVAPDLMGDKGVVVAAGGPNLHVRSMAFIVDRFKPSFAGQSVSSMNSPTKSPPSPRWGDYFTVARHPLSRNTFIGSGAYIASDGRASARWLWFSREVNQPRWVDLEVRSFPILKVPITVDETDRFGRKNGSTNFIRSYAAQQGYELTAPPAVVSGFSVYGFNRWSGSGGTTTSRIIRVSNIGFIKDTMTAFYDRANGLAVRSLNPSSGVLIKVSRTDVFGKSSGTTSFVRYYKPNTLVTLTAPASTASGPFRRWTVTGLPSSTSRVRTILMSGTSNRTAVAEYMTHTHGSFTAFGFGCPTFRPNHFGMGHPDLGQSVTYVVSAAPARTGCAFYFGFSKTRWGAFRLPLSLAFIGMGSCRLDVSMDVVIPSVTNSSGVAALRLPLNGNASAIGMHLYSQVGVLDRRVPWPLKVTHSRALDTMVGGNR